MKYGLVCLSILLLFGSITIAGAGALSDLSRDMAAIAKQASPASVQIEVERTGDAVAFGAFAVPKGVRKSVGSGFIIDPNGYIMTSADVVSSGSSFTVRFSDGTTAAAKLVGSDPVVDVALIKVDQKGLKALTLGDSDSLQPGMLVVTVNSQAGMSNSVSLGVVAAVDRETGCTPSPALQISGTIGPGASGGAVLDTEGRVVGITFAMFSPTTSAAPFNMPKIFITPSDSSGSQADMGSLSDFLKIFQNYGLTLSDDSSASDADRTKQARDAEKQMLAVRDMLNNMVDVSRTTGSSGFAIPINRIKPIIDQLKSGKTIEHAALGMRLEMIDEGIRMVPSTGSPADKAGVKTGDILVSINGRKFQTISAITTYITNLQKGDKVKLVVRRGGKDIPITVTAASRQDMLDVWRKNSELQPSGSSPFPIRRPFSLSLDEADIATVAKALSQASGVSVVAANPDKIKGKVTVHLKSTYLETALPLICEALGCKFMKSGNGYILSPIK